MTATTALTAQNTLGVQDIHHTPPAFLKKQLDAVCDDVGVDVIKTGTAHRQSKKQGLILFVGMLASAETVGIVADTFRRYNVSTSVVDPVRQSITIYTLHSARYMVANLNNRLWYQPLAHICFPNRPSQH